MKYNIKFESQSENYREFEGRLENKLNEMRCSSSWQKYNVDGSGKHPTIKPLKLCLYMLKTYSNKNDTVLDFCMGSGTTGVAAKRLNRKFIGIEKEEKYFKIAKERIDREGEDEICFGL